MVVTQTPCAPVASFGHDWPSKSLSLHDHVHIVGPALAPMDGCSTAWQTVDCGHVSVLSQGANGATVPFAPQAKETTRIGTEAAINRSRAFIVLLRKRGREG
jgi:hypothetical protein